MFKRFCLGLGIGNYFSTLAYPQANRQVKDSNKVILDKIKKRLEEAKGKWVEELSRVMWTHKATKKKSIGETHFALAYGVEAIIPLEVGLSTIRTTEFNADTKETNMLKELDLQEEGCDMAVVRLTSYQQQLKRRFKKNVRPKSFKIGDLV